MLQRFKNKNIKIKGALVGIFLFLILNIFITPQWLTMLLSVSSAGENMSSELSDRLFWDLFLLFVVGGGIIIVIGIGVLISAVIGYVLGWVYFSLKKKN